MTKPFAITLDVGSSLANKTGSWRTERPLYISALPPCNKACPAGEDIQGWLYKAEEGDYEGAWRSLVENNPFPAIMGRVCYHPCETASNRVQVDEADGLALARPVVDVEDISQVNMRLDNGVLASYEQCHFTPDYWRNYTVIGTQGRIENFGDDAGQQVGLWNRRHRGWAAPDETFEVPAAEGGHGGADSLLIREFLRFVRDGGRTDTSPVAAREAVVTGVLAAASLRGDGSALDVPALPADLVEYFDNGQA